MLSALVCFLVFVPIAVAQPYEEARKERLLLRYTYLLQQSRVVRRMSDHHFQRYERLLLTPVMHRSPTVELPMTHRLRRRILRQQTGYGTKEEKHQHALERAIRAQQAREACIGAIFRKNCVRKEMLRYPDQS